jgi:hypothetical protein
MRKVTRRQLAALLATPVVISLAWENAIAQTPASQDWDQQARDSHKQNSMILASFDIPMSVEPAFQFKA